MLRRSRPARLLSHRCTLLPPLQQSAKSRLSLRLLMPLLTLLGRDTAAIGSQYSLSLRTSSAAIRSDDGSRGEGQSRYHTLADEHMACHSSSLHHEATVHGLVLPHYGPPYCHSTLHPHRTRGSHHPPTQCPTHHGHCPCGRRHQNDGCIEGQDIAGGRDIYRERRAQSLEMQSHSTWAQWRRNQLAARAF